MDPLTFLTWTAVVAVVMIIFGIIVPWIIRVVRAAFLDPDPDGSIDKKAKASE